MNQASNYQIVPMGKEHVEQASACVARAFMREPMTKTLGISYQQVLKDFTKPVEKVAENGYSLVTIDPSNGQVVGVCVNKDYTVEPIEEDDGYSDSLPIFTLVDELDALATQLVNAKANEVFHLYILAVDDDHGSKGIGEGMALRTRDIAIKNGFKQIAAEATGPVSQHIAEKFGFDEIARVNYCDFEYQGKKVFAGIDEVEGCLMVVKNLH